MKIYNFSAGPAVLPQPVLERAREELLDWRGSGMSVMEMSHRGKEFITIHAEAEKLLRELLAIPANYKVLFMQGGAIAENAIVPMNLLGGKHCAKDGALNGTSRNVDFINTGEWSSRSIKEASKYAAVNVAASSEMNGYTHVPKQSSWRLDPNAAYVHICCNETIGGVEYHWTPDTAGVPLVADMSSSILSRPVDVSRYGLIYGGAQKNIGPAGLTIVIVREDLLGRALPITPSAFDYSLQAANDSMLNTPPTYGIYIAGLVFQWLKAQGGLPAMEARNRAKAALLYGCLDASELYTNPVAVEDRSLMNVPFFFKDTFFKDTFLKEASLNEAFLKGAEARGLYQLKGHRIVGGMRASIYNAMPLDGVQALVAYLKDFEASHV